MVYLEHSGHRLHCGQTRRPPWVDFSSKSSSSSPKNGPKPGCAPSLREVYFSLLLCQSLSRVRLCEIHGLEPARLLCPWDSPGKKTGVGCHFLLHISVQRRVSQDISGGLVVKTPRFHCDRLDSSLIKSCGPAKKTKKGRILPPNRPHLGGRNLSTSRASCKPVKTSHKPTRIVSRETGRFSDHLA